MAKPRVFISSTYYDLKHLRSSIENFIDQLGYEAVLSEKDNIAYMPDLPLDESCYREAQNSDIYVLIIGGRYGSEISEDRTLIKAKKAFFERYESVTKHEYSSAIERDIPVYILIDSAVDAEYQTFLKNKENKSIEYAHVDSVNIFHFIEEIREKQTNNPIKLFTRYSEIENWLREQWSGLLKELISRMSKQQQFQDLNTKVVELSETSETLKRYLEDIVSKVSGEKEVAIELIKQENVRLREAKDEVEFLSYSYIKHLNADHDFAVSTIKKAITESSTYKVFLDTLFQGKASSCAYSARAFREVNGARGHFELDQYSRSEIEELRVIREKEKEKEKELADDIPVKKVAAKRKPRAKITNVTEH
jgi:hypothetical protein